ncbi:hypothetical protein [Prosthecodimorpha staleyi]|uniref:Uncharacterized protein n=1 Tax=Prosthecodimorpha staleyi TaxID=2840188 RepID=A0A947D2B3_9HYPH|nr:hypothetical protein [Prosthecodimorpha staleyi]MBT9288296.1 hypothetical protein [Prosthecodimorpha staleyi]
MKVIKGTVTPEEIAKAEAIDAEYEARARKETRNPFTQDFIDKMTSADAEPRPRDDKPKS